MFDFAALPPEVTSTLMHTGPGSSSLMVAASAWDALASQLETASRGYATAIAGLQGEGWTGVTAERMAAAAAPYIAWLATTATDAEQTAVRARAAAGAYETALAAVVPPSTVLTNRLQLLEYELKNIFGQYTTAIAALETQYAEMWAQDAHAMYSYASAASSATALTAFSNAPQTTNPSGQSGQAAAVAQTTANSAASHTQSALSQAMQAVPQQLQSMASGASGSGTATTAAVAGTADASAAITPITALSDLNTIVGPFSTAMAVSRTATSGGSFGAGLYRIGLQQGIAAALPPAPKFPFPEIPSAGIKAAAAVTGSGPVLASFGQSAPIGGLSAPPSWAATAPVAAVTEDPYWLSEMELAAAPEAAGAGPMGAAPMAGLGPMAGMAAARTSVRSMLRVEPRRYKMPRPVSGG